MQRIDVRLVPALTALWVGSIAGLHFPSEIRIAVPISLAFLAVRQFRTPSAIWPVLALAIGLTIAAFRVDAAAPAEVQSRLADQGAVQFEAAIVAEPQLREDLAFGGLEMTRNWQAPVTLTSLRFANATWRTSIPATMRWSEKVTIDVGAKVRGVAVMHPDDPAKRSTYRFRVMDGPALVQRSSRGSTLAHLVRKGLARAAHSSSGSDGATLLPGLVLGDTSAQSAELIDALRVSGLSHLTAVSGANLAIIIALLQWLLRRSRLHARYRGPLLIAAIALFVVVVQPQPSVLRAAVMGGIAILAMREHSTSASVLWLSVAVLLIIDPFLAWQWGFALSVAATAGLIVLQPWLSARMPSGWLGSAIGITMSAQIATMPLLVAMGRPPTLVSIPANLLCEPLVAPATVVGFLAAMVAALALVPVPFLAHFFWAVSAFIAFPGVKIADLIAWIAHKGADSAFAVTPISSPWQLLLVLVAFTVCRWLRVPWRTIFISTTALSLLVSCGPGLVQRWPQSSWSYAMCDVGQGDSTVLRISEDSAIVFDVGPDPTLERRCLRDLGVRTIAALFITHFHADHVEGIDGLTAAPGAVFTTTLHEPAVEYARVQQALSPQQMQDVQQGDAITIGEVRVLVLWPEARNTSDDPNHSSLVLDVQAPALRILITGDADPAAQASIALPVQHYAILKMPHHGSKYQDPTFAERANPAMVLISVGEGNDYGHPSSETVAAVRATGARVLRTDLDGAIAVSVGAGGLSYARKRR